MSVEDDFAAYESDAQVKPQEAENILSRITNLVNEAKAAASDVNKAMADLKTKQQRYNNLVEFQIPEAMAEAKQEALKTADGTPVEVAETLYAAIPKARLPEAIMWLTANGGESIIKRKLELGFDKGEDQQASRCLDTLLEEGFTPTDTQSVNPMSLAAHLREMVERGETVPMEMLGAYVRKVAKIKGVKIAKAS